VDWGVALKYSVIGAAIIGGVLVVVFIFDAVWARVGFGAAAVVLAIALYIFKRWLDRDARRAREKFERST
jgi:Flp pilus assembly protein TadB